MILLSEVRHVWSKTNHAKDLKNFGWRAWGRTSRAQMPLVKKSFSRKCRLKMTFSASLCEKKRASHYETKINKTNHYQHFKDFSLTKQKTRPPVDYEWIGKSILKVYQILKKHKRTAKIIVKMPFSRYFKNRAKNLPCEQIKNKKELQTTKQKT